MKLHTQKEKIDRENKGLWYSLQINFENLDGDEFEILLGELYQRKGYKVTKSPKGADNGIDLLAINGNTSIIIQAKNWKGKVSNGDILKTSGARLMLNASYAMVIISSHFTESAKNVIQKSPRIRGMEIEWLKQQIKEYFKKEIKEPDKGTLFEKIKDTITWNTKPVPQEMDFDIKEGKIEQIPYKPRQSYQRKPRTTSNRKPRRTVRYNKKYRKS